METVAFNPSSHIQAAQYDAETKELVIRFPQASYLYADVPQDVVDGFSAAISAGSYLHASIKGRFVATKL